MPIALAKKSRQNIGIFLTVLLEMTFLYKLSMLFFRIILKTFTMTRKYFIIGMS